jgi:hypothetical protein
VKKRIRKWLSRYLCTGFEQGSPTFSGWWETRSFKIIGFWSVMPCSMVDTVRAHSPEVKRTGHEADHSPLSSAEVENGGPIPPLSKTYSWHGT